MNITEWIPPIMMLLAYFAGYAACKLDNRVKKLESKKEESK